MSLAASNPAPLPPGKRKQILAAARGAFGELGFERASVDEVAARARVSKATVYHHFDDKKALFIASFSEELEDMRAGLRACLGEPGGDVEAALRRIGEELLSLLLSPALVRFYRTTVAESARFPELGQILFDRGPRSFQDALASYLSRWAESGALRLDDPRVAALQFMMLCHGDLVIRSQLGIVPHPEEVRATVDRAVSTFLRAHAAR